MVVPFWVVSPNLSRVASLGDLAEVGVTDRAVRILKLRVIPRIEEFRPELQAPPLPELKVPLKCEVLVIEARSGNKAAAGP